MPQNDGSPRRDPIQVEVLGGEATGPLLEALSRRLSIVRNGGAGTAPGSPDVFALDGRTASPEEVAALARREPARPLLVLDARPEQKAALGRGISTPGVSEAFLYVPGAPPRIVEFHRADDGPLSFMSVEGEELEADRSVRSGEVPPPEPEPPRDVPAAFANAAAAFEAQAEAVAREIELALRGEGGPPLQPAPPKGVRFFDFSPLKKVLTLSLDDPYYGNEYAPNQNGQLTAQYRFTGFANLDTSGKPESFRLTVDVFAGAVPSLSGDLLTVVENRKANFPPSMYLGWFQSRAFVGVEHDPAHPLHLLGTSPNTLNKEQKQTTTKGFTFDVGFEVGADSPKVGLNYVNSVSTETKFGSWLVGELSDSRRTAWLYAVAFPYNGLVDGALLATVPATKDFTAPSISGFEFQASAAWNVPFSGGEPPAKLDLLALLGFRLGYYFRRPGGVTRQGFERETNLTQDRALTLDLTRIPRSERTRTAEEESR